MWSTADLGRLRGLSAGERRTLGAAILLLPVVAVCLRLRGFNRTRAIIASLRARSLDATRVSAPRVADLVSVAARRGPFHASCVVQSLALQWLLRRHGIESELRIGVRKEATGFEAHAWVEYEGRVLLDSLGPGHRFAAFQEPIPERRP